MNPKNLEQGHNNDTLRLTTGISGLDAALGDVLTPGHLIGVIGASGAGKTILATQLARRAVVSSRPMPTTYLSTEIDANEIWDRCLSAEISSNYGEPSTSHREQRDAVKEKLLLDAISTVLFCEFNPNKSGYLHEITQHLIAFEAVLPETGGLAIFDYLEAPTQPGGAFEIKESMKQTMAVLHQAASRGKLLIVVFAQAQPAKQGKRYLDLEDTAYCHDLFIEADAFIGIGREGGSDENDEDSRGFKAVYRTSQTLNVIKQAGGSKPIRVPVTTRFEYQRFEDREKTDGAAGGYIPFTRQRFRELCGIQHPPCINVYMFLALKARIKTTGKIPKGQSWHSLEGTSKGTGLSAKQVRTAITKLEKAELISVKREIRKNNRYTISAWNQHHTAAGAALIVDGYVRIDRSIEDDAQRWLYGDPELLRLWMYFLMKAQVFHDSRKEDLNRGHLELDAMDIEHEIGTKEERCMELLSQLEEHGSIRVIPGDRNETLVRIVNWNRYQADP